MELIEHGKDATLGEQPQQALKQLPSKRDGGERTHVLRVLPNAGTTIRAGPPSEQRLGGGGRARWGVTHRRRLVDKNGVHDSTDLALQGGLAVSDAHE